jgi:hypothetical protein
MVLSTDLWPTPESNGLDYRASLSVVLSWNCQTLKNKTKWWPSLLTAVNDMEVEYGGEAGHIYQFK